MYRFSRHYLSASAHAGRVIQVHQARERRDRRSAAMLGGATTSQTAGDTATNQGGTKKE